MPEKIKPINKRLLKIIVLTFITAAVIFKVQNIEPIENKKLFDFPLVIDKWKGTEIFMDSWVFASLETKYSILRNYVGPDGQVINLAIVWYDDREVAFHGASACLGGAGNKVTEMEPIDLVIGGKSKGKIGRLVTDMARVKQLVYYFYISDGYIAPDQNKIRKEIFLKRLKLKRTSAAFIRIMMPIINSQEGTAKKLDEFAAKTLPFINEYTNTKKLIM